jgi:Ca2+-binding RTX toxin-like protein
LAVWTFENATFIMFGDFSMTIGNEIYLPVGNEFFIGDGAVDGDGNVSFSGPPIAMANGHFAVTWTGTEDETNQRAFTRIQVFNTNGDTVGPELSVAFGDSQAAWPAITLLDNGGIAVAYSQSTDDGNNPFDIFLQVFSADGTPGAPTVVTNNVSDNDWTPQLTALSDGTLVLLWTQDGPTGFQDGLINFALFDQTGAVLRAPTVIANNGLVIHEQVVHALSGGGFAVAWNTDPNPQILDQVINLQLFDNTGEPSTGVIEVAADDFHSEPNIIQLQDDRILVTWHAPDQSYEGIYGQFVSLSGALEGSPFLINTTTEEFQRSPSAVALDTGGFVVFWDGYSANSGATYGLFSDVYGQVFDASAQPVGGEFRVNTSRGQAQEDANVAILPSGEIVVTWTHNFPVADARDNMVGVQVFEPSGIEQIISGTDAEDTLTGGDTNDHISGLAGNDLLRGEAGNDVLNGGNGADTLIGGNGDDFIFGGDTEADLRDVIYGGNGNDSIEGGYGNDELRGDAGDDTIEGGFGVDTVIGNSGDDVLAGSAYSDLIFGGNGDDFINGGFGHDRVNGGEGADKFYHLGIFDHGSDWIQDYNAAQGDVLMWGGAAATVDDFQINTADTANAGVDGVSESFVIYRPTGQIIWALVDGDAQSSINIQIAGQAFDVLV